MYCIVNHTFIVYLEHSGLCLYIELSTYQDYYGKNVNARPKRNVLQPSLGLSESQAQAAGQGAANEPPAAQPAPAEPPAQNEAEPEPPDAPPDQGDDAELEEEEGAAAEDADANNGAQG